MPLRDFSKAFKLDAVKEIMPYSEKTKENMDLKYWSVKRTSKTITKQYGEKVLDTFFNNLEKFDCYPKMAGSGEPDKTYFDPMKYAIGYCMQDCRVLKAGYLNFRKSIKDFTNLNIDRYITIQSLANSFIKKQRCMEDVAKVSGIVQAFISKASVGGRVMTNSNKMYHVKGKLADFDANGLYPSAMAEIKGFPMGKPRVISDEELNMKFLRKVTEYYVEIEVTKVKYT